ncbi:GntR family transcriptional regulator [Micromonospora chalcea]|nr:GntR family transcriptional regulator [Micromonospora chalcea]
MSPVATLTTTATVCLTAAPVQETGKQYGYSAPTVRQALARLQERGVL